MANECAGGAANTGVYGCLKTLKPISGLGFQATYDSSGVENKIVGSTVATTGELIKMTRDLDATKRLYPLQNLYDVDPLREDSEFFTFPP